MDVTGKRTSLETCTAMGAIGARIATYMEALKWKSGKRRRMGRFDDHHSRRHTLGPQVRPPYRFAPGHSRQRLDGAVFYRGDVVLLKGVTDPSQVRVNDVIVYKRPGYPYPIIHRVRYISTVKLNGKEETCFVTWGTTTLFPIRHTQLHKAPLKSVCPTG